MENWQGKSKQAVTIILYGILLVYSFFIFFFQSPFVSSWDAVDFVLGVEQFDLLKMQPHFPGYPYFILGGMFINVFLDDPASALITFNQLLIISASLPIILLVRNYVQGLRLALVVLVVQTLSYIALLSGQAMSEAAAIGVLWWFLWSVSISLKSKSIFVRLLPALLFSLLLGIRLSYLPFGIALLFIWFKEWKETRQAIRIILHLVFALLCQLVWVLALAYSEGGIVPFIELSLAFTQGHFQEWGGTAVANDIGIFQRIFQLTLGNFFWNGLAVRSIILAVLYSVLFGLFIFYTIKEKKSSMLTTNKLLLATFISYFIWALFAQNIEKPRHISPLLGIFTLVTSMQLLRLTKGKMKIVAALLLLLLTCGQVYKSFDVMELQKNEHPSEYQLATSKILTEKDLLFTWEETRVLHYLNVPFTHDRVLTYQFFLQKKYEHKSGKIYVTNKVVEGFKKQGIEVEKYITKVAEFSSSSFIDPVYYKIELYEWHEGR
ncbi:hypothetical protein CIB95_06005 [Lottiidibacillus patelloidae]|uniref:Glycosyltransferase RgtA/B/C/D-like domain-containing protein n=1 Tax=Lottiidibacillus patelloidae TaxID=2670334 RepID=A0A263BX66_9BACI|nr:hypothetical protein [Lottiidibacillus patelloidae]OZM57907.1 hypothetical protein CIB95_06005 [Lottiidibacillus patelloidae]